DATDAAAFGQIGAAVASVKHYGGFHLVTDGAATLSLTADTQVALLPLGGVSSWVAAPVSGFVANTSLARLTASASFDSARLAVNLSFSVDTPSVVVSIYVYDTLSASVVAIAGSEQFAFAGAADAPYNISTSISAPITSSHQYTVHVMTDTTCVLTPLACTFTID
ncbi:MAG: hypothetical protein V4440_06380, partial [Pseudomonadota bacterium]